jgi:pimeloyl-ACP methyl ester carboxylesterase
MKNTSTTIKKARKMLLSLSLLLIATLVSFWIYLLIMSPGTPVQFIDKDATVLEGSISEKIFVNIGGVKQGMFVRSKNPDNPVLLFLHGGPGFPNYFLFEKFKPGLEDFFTVCYWEQRGGGLSYSP